MRINPRWIIRSRRLLLVAAALPLLQLGPCQSTIGYGFYNFGREWPSLLLNAVGSAFLNTLLTVLGLNNNNLFGTGTGLGNVLTGS